jgi:hypothetical protein
MSLIGDFIKVQADGDYIGLVKKFIAKLFIHEARKFGYPEHEINIILHMDKDGKISISSYYRTENKGIRMIPDAEAQKILMK